MIIIISPLGPQKLSFLKSQKKIQNPQRRHRTLLPSEMASLSNSRWKNRKERLNICTNHGDNAETA